MRVVVAIATTIAIVASVAIVTIILIIVTIATIVIVATIASMVVCWQGLVRSDVVALHCTTLRYTALHCAAIRFIVLLCVIGPSPPPDRTVRAGGHYNNVSRRASRASVKSRESRDWLSPEEYPSPPHAIGSLRWNIPPAGGVGVAGGAPEQHVCGGGAFGGCAL
eukprot:67901-Pyramimonas_sp.AAC.1